MQQIGDVLTGLQNQQLLDPQNLQRDAAVGRYHPYKSPPDFVMATKHGYAKRVYVSKQEDTFAEEGRENCPCCGLPVEGDLIPLCAELSKLYHLGSGYALYFKFLKYCIAMLVMMFIVTAIYNFASDSAGTGCSVVTATTLDDSLYCLQDYIAKYTIANKRNSGDALAAQQALNLVTIILVIAFFQFIRYELRKTSVVADDNTVTPSDYTVRLSNVPTDVTTREIVDWLQQFGTDEKPVVVRKVCRSYDLVEFTELTRERDALQDEKDHAKIPELIGTIEAQISVVKQKMEDLKKKKLTYSKVAYVTFERASHAAAIENRFDKSLVRHGADFVVYNLTDSPERLHGAKIKVKRAPEPSNILWENLGFSRREKIKRKHMTNFLTGVAILVSFAIILGISYAQSRLVGNGQNESYTIRALSIIASVLISVINFVIGQVARKLAEYEKHGTFTGYFTGVARKLSVAQFLNTAMTTLVAKSIINNTVIIGVDPTTGLVIQDDTINFYGKGGLLEGIFYVFISNAFLTPIMNIFDPFFFLKKWNRRKALENSDSTKYNQKEAHALFEGMPIDMSYKYALLIKTMYLTSFYAPAIPIGIPFAIVGLSMVYWSDKYILLRRAALPFSLGDELSKTMIEYLEWMAVAFAAGNIAFIFTLKNQYGEYAFDSASFVIAWIILVITVAHAFLPMGAVNKKYFPLIDDVTENETYDQARLEFATDYDIENPITREKALIEFRQAIADGARTRDQHTGKSFDDDVANLQRNQSRNSYQHSFEEENHGGHMFNFLEGYIKTSHSNPAQIARENKGQAVVMEAQRQGSNYDRPSSYKKVTGAFRGNAGNMA